MTHVPRQAMTTSGALARVVHEPATTNGLTLSLALEAGLAYLLVGSTGCGDPLTLLLPAQAVSGLTVLRRVGRLHGRHLALVWGGDSPPLTGVAFSSGDLRFRREEWSAPVAFGSAWVAVADGVFREATVDPDGPAPRWLPLEQSR